VRDPNAGEENYGALGIELAAYRRAAGYTQARLAQLTEYSRSTIANVETGRQRVPRDFWERADRVLQTGGVLATAHDHGETTARLKLRAAARSLSSSRQLQAAGTTSAIPNLGVGREVPSPLARTRSTPAASGRCADDGRPAKPWDIDRLSSMRRHLKAIDNAHGGRAALPMADWYLRCEVLPLLKESRGGSVSRTLLDVVAQFQLDVGWMAYDADRQERATEYFLNALRLAHQAGNRLLGARVLAAMSHQAIYIGNLRQAVDLAQAARNTVRNGATPRTVAMLAAMQACAFAAARDARRSQQALDDAAKALCLGTDHEPEWLDFDEGGNWGHAARAYRDLGQHRKAEEYAARSVGKCMTSHSRTRAQRTAIQATAHLGLGEVDAAAAAAERVVQEAWGLHSGHVFAEVRQLVSAIAPFRTLVAKDFLDQAHDLLAARDSSSDSTARS
jgi:transcriptional regulator with XRE-family HTH domain